MPTLDCSLIRNSNDFGDPKQLAPAPSSCDDSEKIKIARDLYDSKQYTVETIAKELGVSRKTVYRHLA